MIVYRITCAATGKIYIGITKRTARARLGAHFYTATRAAKCRGHLHAAMKIHPRDLWSIEEIERHLVWADLVSAEIRLIATHRSNDPDFGYNLTTGGEGSPGRTQSREEIERRVAGMRGKKRTAEQRARMSASTKGKKQSKQHIANNAAARRGYKKTPKQIERSAHFHRGRKRSDLTRARLSAAACARYEGTFLYGDGNGR